MRCLRPLGRALLLHFQCRYPACTMSSGLLRAFVAVKRESAQEAMHKLNAGKVKGKSVRVRLL